MRRAAAIAAALACLAAAPDPAERLPDAAQEARARVLFRETRCLVCQNESIDDSEAALAKDLRTVIRGQIAAGRSDAQVRAFLTARYGEYVLLKPPFTPGNAILWVGPFVVLAAGLGLLIFRRNPSALSESLSEEEEARLEVLRKDETV